MDHFVEILLLLSIAVTIIIIFLRLHIPTSLGYLLVGVIVSPYTAGPIIDISELKALAEFGIVFLLFTIGLSYSLPQLNALRHQVLGLGTAQVLLTTFFVCLIAWAAGMPLAVAFVIGAIFAQSSSSIIGAQLNEQNEQATPYGRLGLAISVFQDVTAVPFLVIIPVLGSTISANILAASLGAAFLKAALAFIIVFFAGRWLFRPLFHLVATRRSSEVFTLTVLLVALVAAWSSNALGLSLAFGAFLAGMMLGETEFRHQVESSIRPFRDVLLGLFFVGIGMLFNPSLLFEIWYFALPGATLILLSKIIIVTFIVKKSGLDSLNALRTALLLSVGGEFGFALLAIALESNIISPELSQIILASVLLSFIAGAFIIRYNYQIAVFLLGFGEKKIQDIPKNLIDNESKNVLIGGYGRVGYAISALLQERGLSFIAIDADLKRVAEGRENGHKVFFGSIANHDLLSGLHAEQVSLAVITVDKHEHALEAVRFLRKMSPELPIVARAKDLPSCEKLLEAGATHAYPEAIESSLSLGATALQILSIPSNDIEEIIQSVREKNYKPILKK